MSILVVLGGIESELGKSSLGFFNGLVEIDFNIFFPENSEISDQKIQKKLEVRTPKCIDCYSSKFVGA